VAKSSNKTIGLVLLIGGAAYFLSTRSAAAAPRTTAGTPLPQLPMNVAPTRTATVLGAAATVAAAIVPAIIGTTAGAAATAAVPPAVASAAAGTTPGRSIPAIPAGGSGVSSFDFFNVQDSIVAATIGGGTDQNLGPTGKPRQFNNMN
jgi:hypothetical protein